MKRKIIIIVLFFSVCISGFAAQNTFTEDSYEYRTYQSLKRISGTVMPQPTLPVSGNQLLAMLKILDKSSFDEQTNAIYYSLVTELQEPEMVFRYRDNGIDFDFRMSAEVFARTADYTFEKGYEAYYDTDLAKKYRDNLPLSEINATLFLDECFVGGFYYDNRVIQEQEDLQKHFWAPVFKNTVDSSAPHKAYGSLGFKNLNLIVGRDRVSAGNGRSGNLGLGDNYLFEDFAKASLVSYPFSYDLTAILFQTETTDTQYGSSRYYSDFSLWNKSVNEINFNDPVELAIQHRFSVALGRYATFSIYESMLEYASNIFGDIRAVNPFMVFHGYTSFRDGNCNNWFGAELSTFLPHNHELNIQVMFDQIQRKVEYDESDPDKGIDTMSPNALGVILNISKAKTIGRGILDTYAEVAVVSHGMYHKEADSGNKHKFPGNVTDLVVGYDDDIQYLGYGYGSNLVAVATGGAYTKPDEKYTFDCIGIVSGNTRKDSPITVGKEYYWKILPILDPSLPGNALEYRLILSLTAEKKLWNNVTLSASADYIHATNFRNINGKTFDDFQFSLGAKISIFGFVRPYLEKIL